MERYLNAKLFDDHLGVASSKNEIFVSALSALIIGHILDYSKDGNSEVLEHLYSFDYVHEGESLGGCHDDCSIKFKLLA